MFDVITFGSATQDILVTPKKLTVLKYQKTKDAHVSGQQVCFPFGSKVDLSEIAFNSGGGGTNTAATFALQGFKTAFCGTVGDDISAEQILKELKSLRIDTGLVKKTTQKPTNHSIVILGEEHDRTILAYRGASELMSKDDLPWGKLKTKWLYLAPLTGLLCDNFEALVDYAVEQQIKIAVNPSVAQLSLPKELLEKIFQKVDVLILNQEEASFLTKVPYEQEQEIFKAIHQLHPKITVMTRGGQGVVVSDGMNMYSALPPEDRLVVDTTGAGDAFGSGFVAEFARSGDVERAIQFAMGNSVGCISDMGAKHGLLKKDQQFERVAVKKEEM